MKPARLLPILLLVTSSAHAQNSGLLLGLRADTVYRTLYIAPLNGRTVAAELPGITVPRADGFWQIEVAPFCSMQVGGAEHVDTSQVFINNAYVILQRRLGSNDASVLVHGNPSDDSGDIEGSCARAKRAYRERMNREVDIDAYCSLATLRLTFVSPRRIAYSKFYQQTEFCNPAKYWWSTGRRVLQAGGQHDSLSIHMTARQTAAVVRHWEAAGQCAQGDVDDVWGIERGKGEWRVVFENEDTFRCRAEDYVEPESPFPLPPAFQERRDPVERWQRAIAHLHPDYRDVFVSPTSGLIVVRARDTLFPYTTGAGRLMRAGEPVTLVPAEHVIMAEWATGAHAARWTRELRGSGK